MRRISFPWRMMAEMRHATASRYGQTSIGCSMLALACSPSTLAVGSLTWQSNFPRTIAIFSKTNAYRTQPSKG